jgi:phage terminase large subunit-like protein
MTASPIRSQSFAQFWTRCVRLVDPTTGAVVTPTPHREQARLIQAVDSNQYHEFLLHWSKQTGKSSTAAAWLLHHTLVDPHHRGERLSGIASNDEDQSAVIFHECEKLIGLDAWLSKNVTVLRNEILYRHRIDKFSWTARIRASRRRLQSPHQRY